MPEQARTLEETCERLSRFETHASRVTAETARKVREVLRQQIIALGGEIPGPPPATITLDGPPVPPLDHDALVPLDIDEDGEEFDFDLDATPESADTAERRRGALYDQDNPRVEDLSQFELPLPEAAEPSLDIPLDDVAPDGAAGSPRLTLISDDEEQVLDLEQEDGEVTLGRGKVCRLRLQDARASRLHCRVFATAAGGWAVEDMGSANGTQVNGTFLTARTPHPLTGGEEIVVGSTVLRYEMRAPTTA